MDWAKLSWTAKWDTTWRRGSSIVLDRCSFFIPDVSPICTFSELFSFCFVFFLVLAFSVVFFLFFFLFCLFHENKQFNKIDYSRCVVVEAILRLEYGALRRDGYSRERKVCRLPCVSHCLPEFRRCSWAFRQATEKVLGCREQGMGILFFFYFLFFILVV